MNQNETMTHTHTPGPWNRSGCTIYAGDTTIAATYCEGNRNLHPIIYPGDIVPTSLAIYGNGWDEAGANARLISAAPELLEALELLASIEPSTCSEMCPYERGIWETAKDAIAKATGKGEA